MKKNRLYVRRAGLLALAALTMVSLRCSPAHAVDVGQPAPDFTLPDGAGVLHHLADLRGRSVVLAFYPKDFTGG